MAFPVSPVVRPPDLISAANGQLSAELLTDVQFPGRGTGRLHRMAAAAFLELQRACYEATGLTLTVTSVGDAYRSYSQQKNVFLTRMEPVSYAVYLATSSSKRRLWSYNGHRYWRLRPGYAIVASPGTSNHGWGLALDVCEVKYGGAIVGIASSGAWGWLLANARDYGFSWEVQSEPWHIRFVDGDRQPPVVEEPIPVPPPYSPPVGWPPFNPALGQFGLWPVSTTKPYVELTDPHTRGDAVLYLQGVILFKAGGNITVDGDYGPASKARVEDLQRWFKLTIDGEVGPATWRTIDMLAGL